MILLAPMLAGSWPKRFKVAIYPGSFDPFHAGHRAVVRQALAVFDVVLVVVTTNRTKTPRRSLERRLQAAQTATAHWSRVQVLTNDRLLTAHLAGLLRVRFLVRGIRNHHDIDQELTMHTLNRHFNPRLITVFFTSDANQRRLSSGLVAQLPRSH